MGDVGKFMDKYSIAGASLGAAGVKEPFTRYTMLGLGEEGNLVTDAWKSLTEGPEMPDPPEMPGMPEMPEPDAPVSGGEEGIRKGAMLRQSKKRALGQLYMTQGQPRAGDLSLGGYRSTLA